MSKKIKISEQQFKKLEEDNLVKKSNINDLIAKKDISGLAHNYAKANDILKKDILDKAINKHGEVFGNRIKLNAKNVLENESSMNKIIEDVLNEHFYGGFNGKLFADPNHGKKKKSQYTKGKKVDLDIKEDDLIDKKSKVKKSYKPLNEESKLDKVKNQNDDDSDEMSSGGGISGDNSAGEGVNDGVSEGVNDGNKENYINIYNELKELRRIKSPITNGLLNDLSFKYFKSYKQYNEIYKILNHVDEDLIGKYNLQLAYHDLKDIFDKEGDIYPKQIEEIALKHKIYYHILSDMVKKIYNENNHQKPLDETTTSASSGAYSTKFFVDPNNGKNQKPLWPGGEIIKPNPNKHEQGKNSFTIIKRRLKESVLKERHQYNEETSLDIDKVKDVANKIKHCGDYGALFVNKEEGKIFWTCADSDGQGEYTSMNNIEQMFKEIPGVKEVEIEAECYPNDESGYGEEIDYKQKNKPMNISEKVESIVNIIKENASLPLIKRTIFEEDAQQFNDTSDPMNPNDDITSVDLPQQNTNDLDIHDEDFDIVQGLVDYQMGDASDDTILKLFSHLIKNGIADKLDSEIAQIANTLKQDGIIDAQGIVNYDRYKELVGKEDQITQDNNANYNNDDPVSNGSDTTDGISEIYGDDSMDDGQDDDYHYENPKYPKDSSDFNNIDWKVLFEILIANTEFQRTGKVEGNPNYTEAGVNDLTDYDGLLSKEDLKHLELLDLIYIHGHYPIIDDEHYLNFENFYNTAKNEWNKDINEPHDNSSELERYHMRSKEYPMDETEDNNHDEYDSENNSQEKPIKSSNAEINDVKNYLKLNAKYGIEEPFMPNENEIPELNLDEDNVETSDLLGMDQETYKVLSDIFNNILNKNKKITNSDIYNVANQYNIGDKQQVADIAQDVLTNKKSMSLQEKPIDEAKEKYSPSGINLAYTHFAVKKDDNKIVDAWDYKGVDNESIKYYSKEDLLANDYNPKDIKIVTAPFLIRNGIDPYDAKNWFKYVSRMSDQPQNNPEVNDNSLSGVQNAAQKLKNSINGVDENIEYDNDKLIYYELKEILNNKGIITKGDVKRIAYENNMMYDEVKEIGQDVINDKENESNEIDETTGSGSSGQFNGPLMGRKNTSQDMIFQEEQPIEDKENYSTEDLFKILDGVKEDMGQDHEVCHKLTDILKEFGNYEDPNAPVDSKATEMFKQILHKDQDTENMLDNTELPEKHDDGNYFKIMSELSQKMGLNEEKVSSAFTALSGIRNQNAKISKKDMSNIGKMAIDSLKSDGIQFVEKLPKEDDIAKRGKIDNTHQQEKLNQIRKDMSDLEYETQPSEMFEKHFEDGLNPVIETPEIKDQFGNKFPKQPHANVVDTGLGKDLLKQVKDKIEAKKSPMYNKDIQPIKIIKEFDEKKDAAINKVVPTNIDTLDEKEVKECDTEIIDEKVDSKDEIVKETEDYAITKEEQEKINEEVAKFKKLAGYKASDFIYNKGDKTDNSLFSSKKQYIKERYK